MEPQKCLKKVKAIQTLKTSPVLCEECATRQQVRPPALVAAFKGELPLYLLSDDERNGAA